MPLPETVDVKYTEEEAEYLSMRPLVRQTFRAHELVDMIVQVAGKDLSRVQQILRSGTIVFHSFRYWWQGFEPDASGLREILATYPDGDSARLFRAEDCTQVLLESSGSPARRSLKITRQQAVRRPFWRRLLNRASYWDALMALAKTQAAKYREYSYAQQADVYDLALQHDQLLELARDSEQRANRSLREELAKALTQTSAPSLAVFVCPRRN